MAKPDQPASYQIITVKGSSLLDADKDSSIMKSVRACVAKLKTDSNDSLVTLTALENSRFSDDAAQGVVAKIKCDAPAKSLLPVLEDAGGRIGVYKLPENDAFDSAASIQRIFAEKAISADLGDPDPLISAPCDIHQINGEKIGWATDSGTASRHFYGVFSTTPPAFPQQQQRRVSQKRIYYGVAHTGAQHQTQQLRDWISHPDNSAMTVKQVADSPQYKRLQSTADRNNRAVLARLCERLGVDAQTPMQDDTEMENIHPDYAPRKLLIENAMTSMTRYGGLRINGEHVLVYPHAIELRRCSGNAVAVPIDPLSGIKLLGEEIRAERALNASAHIGDKASNAHEDALPLGGARYTSDKQKPLTKDDMVELKRVLFWKGKTISAGIEKISQRIVRAKEPLFLTNAEHCRNNGMADFDRVHLEPVAVVVNV